MRVSTIVWIGATGFGVLLVGGAAGLFCVLSDEWHNQMLEQRVEVLRLQQELARAKEVAQAARAELAELVRVIQRRNAIIDRERAKRDSLRTCTLVGIAGMYPTGPVALGAYVHERGRSWFCSSMPIPLP